MKASHIFTASCVLSLTTGCLDIAPESASPPWSAAGASATGGAAGAAGGPGASGSANSGASGSAAAGAPSGGIAGNPSLAGATTGGSGGSAGSGGDAGQAGSLGSGGSAGSVATAPEDQMLYNLNCGLCHGEQGKGGVLAPEIQHPVREYATWVVRNGRAQTAYPKPMDKVGPDKLSDAQLTLIFDYLSQPPQPTTGKALFQDYCANCHGADARGGPTQRDITGEVGKVQELVRNGKSIGQYQMRHDSMPKFPSSLLSDAEVLLIRDYVDSL
jgi:mono/diheme cytochrome c family protein